MKLKNLFWNWTNAIKTFPISHVLLLVLTVIWIWEVEWFLDLDSWELVVALVFAFILSCYGPLFLIHSNLKKKNLINRIFQIWSIVLWWIYYMLLCSVDLDDLKYSQILPYLWVLPLFVLWILLIIAILHRKDEQKIRFSWTNLFIAMVFWSIAWSIIRWWISGALAAIEALFDVYIDSDLYADIGFISEILLAGSFVFNFYYTFTENLNQDSDFEIKSSRLRKIFWSFIFLPLALIYLAIFGAYWIKILITWVWPEWIIIRLWIWYFALWIASSYLIYPDKTKVHEIINKILYVSFILIAFMMIWAIVKRINQYWITINRCFVCYIIVFIIVFSVLSLIFSNKRLLSFVSTLGILGLVSVYWWILSVSYISFNSQVNRIETIADKYNLTLPLTEWALKDMDDKDSRSILWALEELVENYDKGKIINKLVDHEYDGWYWSAMRDIQQFLGVENEYDYYGPSYEYRRFWQEDAEKMWIDVVWYSKLFNFRKYDAEGLVLALEFDGQEYKLDLSNYLDELKEKSDAYKDSSNADNQEMLKNPALIVDEDGYRIVITWFYIEEYKDWKIIVESIEWYVLVK